MTGLNDRHLHVILYEGAGGELLEAAERFDLVSALLDEGFVVTRATTGGAVAPADDADTFVLGRFNDESLPGRLRGADRLEAMDLREAPVQDVIQGALEYASRAGAVVGDEWKPWFPVIDYDRCTNCMQCLSFCLFDVYGVDKADTIEVRNQDKCKTDCPACSRVCPEVAILFPKYGKGPINGDVVREEDIQRESMKVDVSALLGGDIYQSLRGRQKEARKRFSTERDESRALLERKRCLKKLQTTLDIPDEVLMTLPSVGDIQERAERAKQKREKRLAESRTVHDRKQTPSADEWGI